VNYVVELYVEVRWGSYAFPSGEFSQDAHFRAYRSVFIPFPPYQGLQVTGSKFLHCRILATSWDIDTAAFSCKCESIDYDSSDGLSFSIFEDLRENMREAGWEVSNIIFDHH
jgi:hypothetical protein